jgi:hypothetical protein
MKLYLKPEIGSTRPIRIEDQKKKGERGREKANNGQI